MKRLFILLIVVIATNAYGQSFEEKIATLACECLKKQENIDDEVYRKCISNSMVEVTSNNPDDFSKIGTVEGIQGIFLKVDAILSKTCVLPYKKELEKKGKNESRKKKNR